MIDISVVDMVGEMREINSMAEKREVAFCTYAGAAAFRYAKRAPCLPVLRMYTPDDEVTLLAARR